MNSSLSLSFELVYLMKWLLQHEKKMLNALVKHAIKNGFAHDLKKINDHNHTETADQFYTTILDFLVFFEDTLINNLDSITLDQETERSILPAIKKMDNGNFDIQTMRASIQQTKEVLSQTQKNHTQKQAQSTLEPTGSQSLSQQHTQPEPSQEEVKKLLFEHILKNWNPSKNDLAN